MTIEHDETPPSPNPTSAAERRGFLGALGGLLGGSMLAGCLDGGNEPGTVAMPAIGTTPVRWVDTVGTDLRSSPGCVESEVAVARGFAAPHDGGGGVFAWTSSTSLSDDGGTVIEVTDQCGGTNTGRWIRIYSGPLDVRWFGAKAGSATYDTSNDAAIAAAIAASSASGPSGYHGGRILFPPGAWYISSPITLTVKQSIVLTGPGGAGAHSGSTQTRLVWNGGVSGPMIDFDGTFHCGVEGLCLDGGGTCTGGIRLRANTGAAKRNFFDDIRIANMSSDESDESVGFDIGQAPGSGNADLPFNNFSRFWIEGCWIGVRQRGNQSVTNVFEDGVVNTCLAYGMQFLEGDITVSRCFISADAGAVADVFVAQAAQYARFVANTHETFCLTSYLFEPTSETLRPFATLFLGVRVAYHRDTGSPRRIIDYQQTGHVTLVGCTFDGHESGNSPVVYFAPPNVADVGLISEIGSRYLNGASASIAGDKGAYTSLYSNGNPAMPTWRASPLGEHLMTDTRLTMHNSQVRLRENQGGTNQAIDLKCQAGALNIQPETPGTNFLLFVQNGGLKMTLNHGGGPGFYGTFTQPTIRPAVIGSRGGNAALASLLTALANFGLINDSTTA